MRGGLQRRRLEIAALAAIAAVVVTHCGGGEPPIRVPAGNSDGGIDISGYAVKGPISGGTVTAYKLLADMSRGDQLATATTDSTGHFGLSLPAYNGDVLLVVNGGSYAEEALTDGGN